MKFTLTEHGGFKPVVVRFDLPYCVHMKNGDYDVVLCGKTYGVEIAKVWRNSVDCVEDDEVYDTARSFESGSVQTGPFETADPADAARLIGTNMELSDDPHGRFRFTRMAVGLVVPSDAPLDADRLLPTALAVANRFVDVYRFVSKRAYLPPTRMEDVDAIEITDISSGEGVYAMNFGRGLTNALINEAREVQDQVRSQLANGTPVPVYAEILLTARRMAIEQMHRHAVIDAVTALEVYIDTLCYSRLIESGRMTEQELDRLLRSEGQTVTDKMKSPLERAIGWRAPENQPLWLRWLAANSIRRGATHAGTVVSEAQSSEVLDTVESLIAAIDEKAAS